MSWLSCPICLSSEKEPYAPLKVSSSKLKIQRKYLKYCPFPQRCPWWQSVMQSDISGYFDCLPKHHSRLLKHPEKHHYINSCNGVIILLSGMSSDVSHPAGVGFQGKAAVGMSQRLRGGAGASSEMLSPTTRGMPRTVAGCAMR